MPTPHIPDKITSEENYYLNNILNHLKSHRNLDFSQYRRSYLFRRIYSRILQTKTSSIKEYVNFLFAHPQEYPRLINALTINVTDFFRDKEVFRFIAETIVPEIIQHSFIPRTNNLKRKILVWSAGASRGQEPYSLAMIFLEKLQKNNIPPYMVKIIATDIDDESLKKAQKGTYTLKEIENVPLAYKKYFQIDKERKEAVVKEEVRKMTNFLKNDLVSENPPQQNLDLILCRNVFIYFSKELQLEIMKRMAKVLNPGGFLILGKVESIFTPPANLINFNNLNKVFRKV